MTKRIKYLNNTQSLENIGPIDAIPHLMIKYIVTDHAFVQMEVPRNTEYTTI